ncbi:hypothetical protein IPM19_02055 [bacterium]|nr:MAG: hypothetical protein IPM19_02055 [bacterium]
MSKPEEKLDPEAEENLRRYAEVVYRIYQRIKDTPAGEELRLKSQWRRRFKN